MKKFDFTKFVKGANEPNLDDVFSEGEDSTNNSDQEENKTKAKYLTKLVIGGVAVVAIVGIIVFAVSDSNVRALKNAEMVEYSESLVKDASISGIASECFYSTNKDSSIADGIKVFSDVEDFEKWYDKYHDISRITPAGRAECTAQTYFSNNCYAVVVSPTDLFDPSKQVLATAEYTTENGNMIIALSQMDRSDEYRYSVDLSDECKQIYTIVYVPVEEVENTDSISFAIEK